MNSPTYKATKSSIDIDGQQARAAQISADPSTLLTGLPKPSKTQEGIQTMLRGLAGGFKAGGQVAGFADPMTAALAGIIGGGEAQQQFSQEQMALQEQALQTQRAQQTLRTAMPGFAAENPELADMPLDIFIKVAGPISALAKQRNNPKIVTEQGLPIIDNLLREAGIAEDVIAQELPRYEGMEWSAAFKRAGESSKVRTSERKFSPAGIEAATAMIESYGIQGKIDPKQLALLPQISMEKVAKTLRDVKTWKIQSNEYGIPIHATGTDVNNKIQVIKFGTGEDVTKGIVSIATGKNSIDLIYNNYFKLSDPQRAALTQSLDEEGIGANIVGGDSDPDGAGFVQRLRGVVNKALLKPAFAGEQGQKMKALFDILEANIPKIARGLGHTGVLTELDVIKSFGVAPNLTGTMIENKERQRLYNELARGNVEALTASYAPFQNESINMGKLLKKLRLADTPTVAPQVKGGKKAQTVDEMVDDLFK